MNKASSCCSKRSMRWKCGCRGSAIFAAAAKRKPTGGCSRTSSRFDPISYIGYKCNLRRIEDYPNLSNYLRDLYQTPGIAEACDIEGMKRGVFGPAGPIKSNGIIPLGPWIDHRRPHDRARFG